MARRKAPAAAVHNILDRLLAGEEVGPAEALLAAESAAALRRNWVKDLGEAVGFLRGGTPEFESFKRCTQSMMTLFLQYGFVSAAEAQQIWVAIEARS
jgi:hypothetical protein